MKKLTDRAPAQLLVGLLCLLAIDASAQTYVFTDLGTLGGSFSYASGINASGQVVGRSAVTLTSPSHAFLYSGGVMTDLDVPAGPASQAFAINATGQIIGSAYNPSWTFYAFINSGGVMTSLGNPGGLSTNPRAINGAGQIVGYIDVGTDIAYTYSGGTWSNLNVGNGSRALGINSSGQIVGYNAAGGFLLTGGIGGILTGLGAFRPTAINDSGSMVGSSSSAGDGFISHPFSYIGGVATQLDAFGSLVTGTAAAINASGQIVGTAGFPFIYSGGTMTDLNSLVSLPPSWILQAATGINDTGQITGFGMNGAAQQHAFLLTPTAVPEPTTSAAAAGLGAFCLVIFCSRKKQTR